MSTQPRTVRYLARKRCIENLAGWLTEFLPPSLQKPLYFLSPCGVWTLYWGLGIQR